MGKVVNFTKARIAAYLKYSEEYRRLHHDLPRWVSENGDLPGYAKQYEGYKRSVKYLENYKKAQVNYHVAMFFEELENLKTTFKTESALFKFPTIMSKYRKGLNPVTMLYNELQKTLFYFDKENETHVWLLSLFADKEWLKALINAIQEDCNAITRFQLRHVPETRSKQIEREISVLNNVRDNLIHYREVFMLMEDMTSRYLK